MSPITEGFPAYGIRGRRQAIPRGRVRKRGCGTRGRPTMRRPRMMGSTVRGLPFVHLCGWHITNKLWVAAKRLT